MSNDEKKLTGVQDKTRRTFMRNSGLTVGGLIVGGAVGSLFGMKSSSKTVPASSHVQEMAANPNEALMFFNQDQYQTTAAAAERIFPKDETGPGAKDLNVAIYIDHQLASPWGVNAKDYMMGPFKTPDEKQGGQLRILRKDLFVLGLNGLNDYSNKKYQKKFTEIEAKEQDQVLVDFESGKAGNLSGVSTSAFFKMLRTLTIEGAYADPMYGGNKDMQGWKMRKYPGAQMGYTKEIQSDKFVELTPHSLHDHMSH
ncbi:gluconate 2-dehydrogenase subunit 3 family protein [Bacillus sp. ISL-18]|uniref:gluconate 2-dehydrogenase subunit 3 family protein n=1 Tax=Bacillus sp. ISL-18 TaxID=2819118 RepID=UPI0027E0C869|nr:gluconate 2-dehydrogenase subunit 3 family protein [Bacillus sp. ISL-18]